MCAGTEREGELTHSHTFTHFLNHSHPHAHTSSHGIRCALLKRLIRTLVGVRILSSVCALIKILENWADLKAPGDVLQTGPSAAGDNRHLEEPVPDRRLHHLT